MFGNEYAVFGTEQESVSLLTISAEGAMCCAVAEAIKEAREPYTHIILGTVLTRVDSVRWMCLWLLNEEGHDGLKLLYGPSHQEWFSAANAIAAEMIPPGRVQPIVY